MTAPRVIGRLSDGREVQAHTLGEPGGGLQAQVWSFGARLHSLKVGVGGGKPVQVLQAPADLAATEADGAYHDCVIGRVANRIDGARFELDGHAYRTDPNEKGVTTLHSGAGGWHHAVWSFEHAEPRRCVLRHDAPDGEGGFPGAATARVTFALAGEDALEITWEAESQRSTPVAMTHHLYFNLSGRPDADILDHELRIAASAITAVDDKLIPTGELMAVEGTVLDFRHGRPLRDVKDPSAHPQLAPGKGLDLNFVLDRREEAVSLRSPESGMSLHVTTDQPGLQVYAGQTLGPPFRPYGALALEPQDFPDAVNRPEFPSVVLRPPGLYRRFARYRFQAG